MWLLGFILCGTVGWSQFVVSFGTVLHLSAARLVKFVLTVPGCDSVAYVCGIQTMFSSVPQLFHSLSWDLEPPVPGYIRERDGKRLSCTTSLLLNVCIFLVSPSHAMFACHVQASDSAFCPWCIVIVIQQHPLIKEQEKGGPWGGWGGYFFSPFAYILQYSMHKINVLWMIKH